MFAALPGALAIAVLLSLTPAALRWWWGRALARLADDPLLPERLAAHNRRFSAVSAGCSALLVVGWPSRALWTVPLLIVAQAAGGFPLRKTLYQETWSLVACLSFFGRLTVAVFGFWVLLAAAPWLASLAGPLDWVAAAGLAVVLAGWNRYSADVLRRLLRTRPMTTPAIVRRFEALVSASGLPMPRFEYVAMSGGVLANAVAVPSLRGSSVVFTDTLLSRLTEDEAAAICAHELAHLEYYDRARLRRLNAVNVLLIAGAAALTPITRLLSGSSELGTGAMIWPGVLIVALAVRAKHRQRNETVSDLRAVALTGDAEALARALTVLHTVARVPRRWDQKRERQATHPSLARRIRDIRASAGMAAATLGVPATFRAIADGTVVTFEPASISWQERPGVTHVLDYAGLVELRLNASATGAVTLVAAGRQGGRWQMAPGTSDLPALQAVLDVVDGRITHDPRVPALSSGVTRLVAGLAWALGFLIGQFAFGMVALLAALSPAPSLLCGAGAAAFAAAALMLRDGTFASTAGSAAVLAAVLAAVGAGLVVLGRARADESARGTAALVGVLAVCGALAVVRIGLDGLDPIRLHQAARSAPAATVLLAALAGACWSLRGRRGLRHAAFAIALAAASTGVLGSTQFLDRVGRDPFLLAASPVTRTAMAVPPLVEFDVPFDAETLRLSPHGRLAALARTDEDEGNADPAPPLFQVGRTGGTLSPLEAADLVFIDDHRALVLVAHDGAGELRDVSLDGSPVVNWRLAVPDIRWGALTYDAPSSGWTLVGRDTAGRFTRVAGTVHEAGMQRTTWTSQSKGGGWIDAIAARGGALLAVEKRYAPGAIRTAPLLSMAPWLARPHSQSQLWRLQDGRRVDAGQSLLDVSCASDVLGDDRLVCTAFDGTRTRIVAIDPGTASVAALAVMDGRFRTDERGARGWLTGWWESRTIALRLGTREAFSPPDPAGDYVHLVTTADAVLGTVAWRDGGSRVRVYPLPGTPVPAGVRSANRR